MAPSLTKKQKQVLDFIKSFLDRYGHVPSYEEIAAGVGVRSASTVYAHVRNLVDKGYLTKRWNANRSLDLRVDDGPASEAVEAPLIGRIAAGRPIEAVDDRETIPLPSGLLGRGETYVLEVKGDSMKEDHIVDGDFVIVEKRDRPENGDMVVALVKGADVTLKRFRRDGSTIRLEPANPQYEPIILDEHEVTVQGVVIGLLRKFRRR